MRRLSRTHRDRPLAGLKSLLRSKWHEERALSLLILVERYRRGSEAERTRIFDLYISHTAYINNWDLVDCSAEYVIGAHLGPGDMKLLDDSHDLIHKAVGWMLREIAEKARRTHAAHDASLRHREFPEPLRRKYLRA